MNDKLVPWSQADGEPFLARAHEMGELVGLLGSARQGQGAIVGVKGGVGVGKTRLAQVLGVTAGSMGMRVLAGRASTETDRAYAPLVTLLRWTLGVGEGASDEDVRQLLQVGCAELGLPETERHHLANVLMVDAPTSPLAFLDGKAIRWGNMTALRSCLAALSRSVPQLVILDDMHAADTLTREVVDFLAKEIASSRTLVLLLYRRGYTAPAYAREIVLSGLAPEATSELVRELCPDLAADGAAGVVERAEGNPLYVTTALRHLSDVGALERGGGAYRSLRPWRDAELPAGLDALFDARMGLLDPPVRKVAELASVIGSSFAARVLARIEAAWPHAVSALEDLVERGIVAVEREGCYVFTSSFLRDVVFAGVDPRERRELQRQIADSLESLYLEGAGVELERIAHHLGRAGERARCATYYLMAARQARGRHRDADAERLYRGALGHLNPSTERIGALVEMASTQQSLGWLADAIDTLRQALSSSQELGDRQLEGRSLLELGVLMKMAGRTEESELLLSEALATLRELGERGAEAGVLRSLAQLQKQRGVMDEARRHCEQALAIYRDIDNAGGEAVMLSQIAALDHQQGRMAEAKALNERALQIHRIQGDRKAEAIVLRNIAGNVKDQGQVEEARDLYEAAIAIHREVGDRAALGITIYNLAILHAEQGRVDSALALGEQSLRIHREVGNRASEGATLGFLATLHQEQGHLELALALYTDAIAIQREVEYWPMVAVNLGFLAELHQELGDHEKARSLLDESLQLHRKARDPRWESQALVRMANLKRDLGSYDEAHVLYEGAIELAQSVNDRRAEAAILVQHARSQRCAGEELAACQVRLASAYAILSAVDDRLEMLRCLVEQGHVALAGGRDAREFLAHSQRLVEQLRLEPKAPSSRAVSRLAEAVAAREGGRPLWRGELPDYGPRTAGRAATSVH